MNFIHPSTDDVRWSRLLFDIVGGTEEDLLQAEDFAVHRVDVLRGPVEDGTAPEISLGDFHTSGKMDENHNSELNLRCEVE